MSLELAAAQGDLLKPSPRKRNVFAQFVAGRKARLAPALALSALIVGFLGSQLMLPLGTAVKIGADEDYELAKATLCNHGYKLYTEIWNDQPPLVTHMIAKVAKNASNPIRSTRLMTVAFSMVLVASVFVLVRALGGTLAAFVATVLLIGSPGFLELSCSVMQEILAFAPIVASLAILWLGPRNRFWWAILLAGFVFGLALQMKLIGVAYLPLAGLMLWLKSRQPSAAGKVPRISESKSFLAETLFRTWLAFGASVVVTFVVLNWLTGNSLLLQLQESWAAHFAQAKSMEYGSPDEHGFDWTLLLKNWDATLPAIVGVCVLLRRCRLTLEAAIPLVWLGLSLLVFGTHKPWWPYYYIHNAVPLAFCAGVGISGTYGWLGSRFMRPIRKCKSSPSAESARKRPMIRVSSATTSRPWCQAALVGAQAICTAAWIGSRISLEQHAIRQAPRIDTALELKEIERFKPFTKFMFSDQPIYSFHADLPMPPRLAVISLKRFWTGDLSSAGLAAELESAKPGLILLSKASQQVPYEDLLNREYRLVYQDGAHRLYAHESIAKKPSF